MEVAHAAGKQHQVDLSSAKKIHIDGATRDGYVSCSDRLLRAYRLAKTERSSHVIEPVFCDKLNEEKRFAKEEQQRFAFPSCARP